MAYPLVSKAVRDSAKKDHNHHGEDPGGGHHCCGMMQGGLGYQDLDELVRSPKSLTFELGK